MGLFGFGKDKQQREADEAVDPKRTKIFVSHRYDEDQTFLAEIRDRLGDHVIIEDDSLTKEQMVEGPRGEKRLIFQLNKKFVRE